MEQKLLSNSMNHVNLLIWRKQFIVYVSNFKKSFQEILELGKLVFTSMTMTLSQYLKMFLISLVVIIILK